MLTGRDYLVQMQRYEAMLREAETVRLMRQAPQKPRRNGRLLTQPLRHLKSWWAGWVRGWQQRHTPRLASSKPSCQIPEAKQLIPFSRDAASAKWVDTPRLGREAR